MLILTLRENPRKKVWSVKEGERRASVLWFRRDYQLWNLLWCNSSNSLFEWLILDFGGLKRTSGHVTKESSLWSRSFNFMQHLCRIVLKMSMGQRFAVIVLAWMKGTTGQDHWMTHCSTFMQEMKYLDAAAAFWSAIQRKHTQCSKQRTLWLTEELFTLKTPCSCGHESSGNHHTTFTTIEPFSSQTGMASLFLSGLCF